jgi:hypothetical protein
MVIRCIIQMNAAQAMAALALYKKARYPSAALRLALNEELQWDSLLGGTHAALNGYSCNVVGLEIGSTPLTFLVT